MADRHKANRRPTLEEIQSWKTRALIVGGILGGLVGAGAAYLMVQNAEEEGQIPSLTAGQGMRLGLLVLGMLRQVAVLGEEK